VITGVDESEVYARSRRQAAQLWARM
jgi:hypothetical protein